MNAKKCDRCGKYYDKNSEHIVSTVPIKYAAGVRIYDDNESYREIWDLCDDCLTEFFNWMNKGKQKGIKNETSD